MSENETQETLPSREDKQYEVDRNRAQAAWDRKPYLNPTITADGKWAYGRLRGLKLEDTPGKALMEMQRENLRTLGAIHAEMERRVALKGGTRTAEGVARATLDRIADAPIPAMAKALLLAIARSGARAIKTSTLANLAGMSPSAARVHARRLLDGGLITIEDVTHDRSIYMITGDWS